MSRKRKIPEPRLQPGRKTYSFNYYDCEGKRKQFSTGETDYDKALAKARIFHRLYGLEKFEEEAMAVNPDIYRAYFNIYRPLVPLFKSADRPFTIKECEEIESLSPDLQYKIASMVVENRNKEVLIERLTDIEEKYNQLSETIEARQIEASKNCPTYKEALKLYEEEYSQTVSSSQCTDVMTMHSNFLKYFKELGDSEIKPTSVTPAHIRGFLTKTSENSDNPKSRQKKARSLISNFFYWAAERYGFTSPFTNLRLSRSKETARRQIIWHDLPVIEDLLNSLDIYWRAIVATMAYAGIGLKELAGIRNEDFVSLVTITEDGKKETRYQINIEWHEERGLKNKNRADSVPVDEKYLLRHLKDYIKAGFAGDKYLFAKPVKMRKVGSENELWTNHALSKS